MINRVELKNFGPIEQLDWQNLGKINLVIGNNGCGKSILLKALYSAMRTIEEYKRGDNPDSVAEILKRKLYWTFQTGNIIDLIGQKIGSPLTLKLNFEENEFSYSVYKELIQPTTPVKPRIDNSIFLPAKEVLSLHNLILTSRELDKLFGFDDTYLDLVKALQGQRISASKFSLQDIRQVQEDIAMLKKLLKVPTSSDNQPQHEVEKVDNMLSSFENIGKAILDLGEKYPELEGKAPNSSIAFNENRQLSENNASFEKCIKKLTEIIGGKIEYDNVENRWYFNKGDKKFSMGVTAEGIKKIGILETLLSNGYLNENSIIFIDELESNLHPTAITQLLDIVTILAKYGIQFFIASHSYFVIKKLFLIAKEQQMSIPVLSYQNNEWVQSDLKNDLPDNPIVDESIRLYEEQLDLAGV